MNNLLKDFKIKFNNAKKNVKARTLFISIFALLLICCITFAWYINNLGIWGVTFSTGNIEFITYVLDDKGNHMIDPISSDDPDSDSKYINAPLISINDAQIGTTGTAYIAVESVGSLGIQYKIAFGVDGKTESTTYLGGYKYTITKVTDKVELNKTDKVDVSKSTAPEKINKEMITIDRNPVVGIIEEMNGYDIYRFDYTLANKNEEYTDKSINIYFNIFATQIDGTFDENVEERGYTYYCSTKEDIDRVKVEAYPGDIIKLSSDIVYYGDLVFNKPINLETNDFTLTVNGNLMYDYVLGNSLKIDAGGLGRIVVKCADDGIGGNFTIKAPISDVSISGSNSTNGDIVVEKNFSVDATRSAGSPGVSFNNIRIVDKGNARKDVLVDSDTRVTVSFGTTIGAIKSLSRASNIEIVNNGVINEIDLSSMKVLNQQTNTPQIYILNNNDINSPIVLPRWSEKFVESVLGTYSGNTRIVQSITGSPMTVTGNCPFDDGDIEIEKKEVLVEQIEEGNDSALKVYYQNTVDIDGNTVSNTIQSILENYFKYDVTTDCRLDEVLRLEIISIGTKAITNADIDYLNSDSMLALEYLDMERANMYDTYTDTSNKLPMNAFRNASKYKTLILPQNLEEIGDAALYNCKCENIITIPSNVTVFGSDWFRQGQYVYFASSVPMLEASYGLSRVEAIFVDEPYIESYKEVFSSYYTKIYPYSQLDESKRHFVRNIKNDEWEITYYITGEEDLIGDNITIDGSELNITSIYDNAYRHNYRGTSVIFADSVELVGESNFNNNSGITYVNLNSVKTVEAEVFYNCSKLSQVVFGDSLEIIGESAFEGCKSLAQDVELPVTMQEIGYGAFQLSAITSINTGGTKVIEGRIFHNCTSLISAAMPEVEIAAEFTSNEIFNNCSSLVSADMPKLRKASGNSMFRNCTSLREVYMGAKDDGVSLGASAFSDTSKLKMYVPEENLALYQKACPGGIPDARIFPRGEKMGTQLVNGFNIGEYIVLKNNDSTYSLVTSNIHYTGSLVVPTDYNGKAITVIYANAFRNQNFVGVKVTIGNKIKTIGNSAFRDCGGITDIDFGNSVEVISAYALRGCANLAQNIVLPDSMKSIEEYAFAQSGVTGINTGGTASIGCYAFVNCSALVYAELPNVTTISAKNGFSEAFSKCSALVSFSAPVLSKVEGAAVLGYCTSLREVYMGNRSANVTLGSSPFTGVNNVIKLYVPEDLVDFYKGKNIVSSNRVYPQGVKVGNKSVNGYNIGEYVVLDKGSYCVLVTSNLEFSGTVTVPEIYDGKPIREIYNNAFMHEKFTSTNLRLGDNVEYIGESAFGGLTGLISVTMDNVTTVGNKAFSNSGITVLNAPKLESAGESSFAGCMSLGVVNVPEIVDLDKNSVFANCKNLKSIYFEKLMNVYDNVFNGCTSLEKITINKLINNNKTNMPAEFNLPDSAPCKIYVPYRSLQSYGSIWSGKQVVTFDTVASYNGDTYIMSQNNEGKYQLIDFIPSKTKDSLVLPSTVTAESGNKVTLYAVKYGALVAVSGSLKNITISSTIGQLDNQAFSECSALENIYTESANLFFTSVNGVLYSKDEKMLIKYPVGRKGEFNMNSSDFSYTVGIAGNAFSGAVELTGITFPQSLLVVDSTAFSNCSKLDYVEFTGIKPPTLMGSGIFDTGVDGFKMVIPINSSDVVNSYLCALNFAEYEPYINIGSHSAPSSNAERNQVPLDNTSVQRTMYASLRPRDDEEDNEELPEEDTTSGDDPDAANGTGYATESDGTSESAKWEQILAEY